MACDGRKSPHYPSVGRCKHLSLTHGRTTLPPRARPQPFLTSWQPCADESSQAGPLSPGVGLASAAGWWWSRPAALSVEGPDALIERNRITVYATNFCRAVDAFKAGEYTIRNNVISVYGTHTDSCSGIFCGADEK